MMRRLAALFTYGTLRPGQPNFRLIGDSVAWAEPARLVDHVLYGQGLPFPYAAPGPGTVIGDLLWFPAGQLTSLLPSLDALEGFYPEASEQHYVRVLRKVQAGDGWKSAWVYLAGALAQSALNPERLVPSGDWATVPI